MRSKVRPNSSGVISRLWPTGALSNSSTLQLSNSSFELRQPLEVSPHKRPVLRRNVRALEGAVPEGPPEARTPRPAARRSLAHPDPQAPAPDPAGTHPVRWLAGPGPRRQSRCGIARVPLARIPAPPGLPSVSPYPPACATPETATHRPHPSRRDPAAVAPAAVAGAPAPAASPPLPA